MADHADMSDVDIEQNIINQRKALNLQPEYKATGNCLNCGHYFGDDTTRWCDDECRDDFLDSIKRAKR